MDRFRITSPFDTSSLEFYERTPSDPQHPVERFKVRVTDQDLVAEGRVYAGYANTHPAPLFAQLASNWKGWQGEFVWESLEGELALRCSQDRAGHVFIRVSLSSGHTDQAWNVRATIMAEAGQLEELARSAEVFFGKSG
jgi:hypothetical protein